MTEYYAKMAYHTHWHLIPCYVTMEAWLKSWRVCSKKYELKIDALRSELDLLKEIETHKQYNMDNDYALLHYILTNSERPYIESQMPKTLIKRLTELTADELHSLFRFLDLRSCPNGIMKGGNTVSLVWDELVFRCLDHGFPIW
jgi:hypothetical protein